MTQTVELDRMLDAMGEKFVEDYNNVEPGQTYPEWFTSVQLEWIKEAVAEVFLVKNQHADVN